MWHVPLPPILFCCYCWFILCLFLLVYVIVSFLGLFLYLFCALKKILNSKWNLHRDKPTRSCHPNTPQNLSAFIMSLFWRHRELQLLSWTSFPAAAISFQHESPDKPTVHCRVQSSTRLQMVWVDKLVNRWRHLTAKESNTIQDISLTEQHTQMLTNTLTTCFMRRNLQPNRDQNNNQSSFKLSPQWWSLLFQPDLWSITSTGGQLYFAKQWQWN